MTVAAVLSVIYYVLIVRSQGGSPGWSFFLLMVPVVLGAGISSLLNRGRARQGLLLAASIVAAGLGFITLTSIGLPLLLTAVLGLMALGTSP